MFAELFFLVMSLIAASDQNEDAEGKHWALLVASDYDWWNYRHQVLIHARFCRKEKNEKYFSLLASAFLAYA